MSRLAEAHVRDGLVVLAVNAWDESKEQLKRYAEKEKLAHRILLQGSTVADAYHVSAVPVTLWINREGMVVDSKSGFDGAEEVRQKTRKLLTAG